MNARHTDHRLLGLATAVLTAAMLASTAAPVAGAPIVETPTRAACPAPNGGPPLLSLPSPGRFRRHVTHDYFPLRPGSRWVYQGFGSERGQREVVTVLARTKRILGIRATIVRDIATEDGEVIERTFDWFAQDRQGRVWYLGEATTSYDGGAASTEGSWRAGRSCARAGVVMFPRGRIHQSYRQEYRAGEAEDIGMLLDRRARVRLGDGRFRHVWLTKDTTPLEPGVLELKLYAPGVGLVLEVGTSPEQGRVELVSFRRG